MVELQLTKIARVNSNMGSIRSAIPRKAAGMMDLEIRDMLTGCRRKEMCPYYEEAQLVVMA